MSELQARSQRRPIKELGHIIRLLERWQHVIDLSGISSGAQDAEKAKQILIDLEVKLLELERS